MLCARTAFQACVGSEPCVGELYLDLQCFPTIKVNNISSPALLIFSLLFPAGKKTLRGLEGACPEGKHGPPPQSREGGAAAVPCSALVS